MFVRERGSEKLAVVHEGHLHEARRDRAAHVGADLHRQLPEAEHRVVVVVRQHVEVVFVRVKRGQLGVEFAQLQIEHERRERPGGDERRQTRGEAVERAQPHDLLELQAAQGLDGEPATRHLHDQFLAAGLDLARQVAHDLAQHRRGVEDHARGDEIRVQLRHGGFLRGRARDAEQRQHFQVGAVLVFEQNAGVEPSDHQRLGVLAGVLVGALNLTHAVDELGARVAAPAVERVGAGVEPQRHAQVHCEPARAGGERLLDVHRGQVGVLGKVDLQAAGHHGAQARELDAEGAQVVGGERGVDAAVGV